MPAYFRKAQAKPKSTLHGLIVLDRLGQPVLGMNRSIVSIAPYIRRYNIRFHYIASSSPHRFLLSAYKILLRTGRFKFDFVIFNSAASLYYVNILGIYTSVALPLFRLFTLFNVPMYVYWHETEWAFEKLKNENPSGLKIIDRISSHPDVIHLTASNVCNHYIEGRYSGKSPICINECSVVPVGDKKTTAPENSPKVVNIASIQERKGTDLFVKTAIEVCKKHPTVEFVWIGEGKKFGTWEKDIQMACMQDRIRFPGYMYAPYDSLRTASLFFLTSRDDPFPLSVLEAMCLRRTIITFNVGGAPEALGGHGILIEPFNTNAAANEILKLLDNPPKKLINEKVRDRYYQLYTPEIFSAKLNDIVRKRLESTK